MGRPFNYGGQAVIEGVMMRGSRTMAVALRHPQGTIVVKKEPLNEALYRGPLSRIPFLRGLVMLWDALGLGTKALMMSADVAAGDEVVLPASVTWGTALLGIGLGVALFMLLPSFLVGLVAPYIPSEWLNSLLEGVVRLLLIVGYIWAVGFLPDIRRVFAYHGAEHKTVNAYEAGAPLTVDGVRPFSTAHTRCGTAFLLTLIVLTILIFAPFGRPSLVWRLLSRIVLLPVIAGVAYELIRLTARLANRPWMRPLIAPNLLLQQLTTRAPDDGMLEVAVAALQAVLADEGDRETGGQGDKETRGQGDKETGGQGDEETRGQGDKGTGRRGDKETGRRGAGGNGHKVRSEGLELMEDVLAAMRQRVSVRNYGDHVVEPAVLEQLLAAARTADHLTGVPPRIALVSGVEQTRHVLTYIVGVYGLVQNPPHLLVGTLPQESDAARLDLGYVLEQVVLEATRAGLGTCWVSGSFDAQRAGDVVGLAPGEVAAAVCALGYPDQERWGRFHSRTVRRLVGGHRRKPLTEIVFSEHWGARWSPEGADPALVAVLEHARLAPSAVNRQPWRFIVRPGQIALALTRPAPIDGGIVMAHVTLASAALGRAGRWERIGDGALAQEYGLPPGVTPVAVFQPKT